MLVYTTSIAANFVTSSRPGGAWIGMLLVALAIVWNVYLFWPEIKALRIVYPPNAHVAKPGWLYCFAAAALFSVLFGIYRLYTTTAHLPTSVTGDEFAQPYIRGKFVRMTDFADAQNMVIGRTFEDSYIYGPVTLYGMSDLTVSHAWFSAGSPDGAFVVVKGMGGPGTGIIALKDVRFIRCHFVNVTFVGSEADVMKWRREVGQGSQNEN